MTDPAKITPGKLLEALLGEWQKAIIGKQETLRLVMISLLCRGHLLLEDMPGLGKTTLAKALASSLELNFKRIQCTPDLLPADITGVSIFDQKSQAFRFVPGPVFTNILLADEINRTSPRTQSALLEAMAERTVTVDRKTRKLPATFMVIATQNPIEFSGTFPLPEAQLDRFFMRISLGYPDPGDESRIMRMNRKANPLEEITPVLDEAQLQRLQEVVTQIRLEQNVIDYIAALIQATRQHKKIRLGVSPRGSIALMKAAQASALLHNDRFVTPLRVQELVAPVLAHRMLLRSNSDRAEQILEEIVMATPVPAMPAGTASKEKQQRALDLV
ncbi:MAG: MoxR family ATPase [Candidatus Thiodiazotropha sp. (ex Dulcina madagascariensis)]|nr:MoxR family ATPase [Candidatus Thiodiazotropha sp. (ex Dulcina madagascariensis)]